MEKLYKILALLLAIFSTSYSTGAIHLGDVKTSFNDGDEVLIYSASANEYLAGFNAAQTSIIKTSTLGEENVYILLSAPDINGNPAFILKQKSTALYMQVLSTTALYLNARESNGTPFQFMTPTQESCTRWWPSGLEDYDATVSFDDITLMGIENPNEGARDTIPLLYFSGYWTGNPCYVWRYVDTNAWVFYSINSSSRPAIGAILEQYSTESFIAGSEPTMYPQELVEAFISAYTAAEEQYNNPAATEEELTEAYTTLEAALQAVIEGVIPLSGYYRIINAFGDFFNQQGFEKAIYDNGGRLLWGNLNPEAANQIFKFNQLESGNFAIQNLYTGLYINNNSGQSAATYTSESPHYETLVIEVFPTDGSPNDGEKQYNIFSSNSSYAFHVGGHSGGAGVSGEIVGWNGDFGGGSAWILRAVSEEEVALLMEEANQEILNNKLSILITEGYSAYYAAATKKDNGIASAEQYSSNADHNALNASPDGGGFPALLDDDTNTFFHSAWGNGPAEHHYLQAELEEPLEIFSIAFTRRIQNNNNRPINIAIWASNDVTEWDSITAITSGLPTSTSVNSYSSNPFHLEKPYKHLRFVVMETNNGATNNGFPFFTFSEFQVYSVYYDEEGSIKEYREIADKLVEELKRAEAVENATQADVDALQAAYDEFIDAVPDPAELLAAIASANGKANSAIEGDEPGQYATGAVAELQEAIEAAQGVAESENPTKAGYAAAIIALEEALEEFQSKLNTKIVANKWYYIKGSSQGAAYMQNKYMYYHGHETYTLQFSDFEENNDMYLWRFIQLDDSLYAIQNYGTGEFITTSGTRSACAKMSATRPGKYMVTALGGDAFNLNEYGQLPLHAQADSTAIVYWAGGIGSASVWIFESAEIEEETELVTVMQGYTIDEYTTMCLPIALEGIIDGIAYRIVGVDRNNDNQPTCINLKEYQGGVVPAGMPFILKAEASEIYFSWGGVGTNTAGTHNGLIGTFSSLILENGYGYVTGSSVSTSNGGYVIGANKAYIDESLITINEESDDFLDIAGVLTQIEEEIAEADVVDVFTTTGVRLRSQVKATEATSGLAKGIYLVGKKKVVVK